METIIWTFHNVMPWVGVYFAVMTVFFLISLGLDILKLKKMKMIHSHYDITKHAVEGSVIVNLIPMVFIKLISWSVERLIKELKINEEKT